MWAGGSLVQPEHALFVSVSSAVLLRRGLLGLSCAYYFILFAPSVNIVLTCSGVAASLLILRVAVQVVSIWLKPPDTHSFNQ